MFNSRLGGLAPAAFGVFMFVVNHLAVWSGWLKPPEGYYPLLITRSSGVAGQMVWFQGFRDHWLLPSYQVPWKTEPAFFTPLKFSVGRSSALLGVDVQVTYLLFHLFFHITTAYALFYFLRVFCATRRQALVALLLALCAVPLQSLATLPGALLGIEKWRSLPGVGDFVYWSADGFLHGISGSLSSTFGTGIVLFAMSFLARYLETGQWRYLRLAGLAAFLSGAFHPFEIYVISIAGLLVLVLRQERRWPRVAKEVLILGVPAGLALSWYAVRALQYEWLRDQATVLKWHPGSPLWELKMLGLPAIVALLWMILRPRLAGASSLLLQCWFLTSLIGIYVPVFNWTQHFFDGFHYATAVLLIRQFDGTTLSQRFARFARPAAVAFAGLCLLAVTPHVAYRIQSFRDGRQKTPEVLMSTVAPIEMRDAIHWFRNHASAEQLVLAPRDEAGWYATAPMHSLASHAYWSMTYTEQASLSDRFFAGKLSDEAARELLNGYGVSFVVVPEGSPALRYVQGQPRRARIGSLTIYEIPGNSIKPYPGLARLRAQGKRIGPVADSP